jgi:hypothetical protein
MDIFLFYMQEALKLISESEENYLLGISRKNTGCVIIEIKLLVLNLILRNSSGICCRNSHDLWRESHALGVSMKKQLYNI